MNTPAPGSTSGSISDSGDGSGAGGGTSTGTGTGGVLTRSLWSAVVPVATCLATLGTLTAWTATGNAGQPRGLEVSQGRIFTPLREGATSAYFTIRNTGAVTERLTAVTAPRGSSAMLSRNITTGSGARSMTMVPYISVPPRSTLRMSPYALNVMVTPAPRTKPGDRLRFTLRFEDRKPITVRAVAVRPGELR